MVGEYIKEEGRLGLDYYGSIRKDKEDSVIVKEIKYRLEILKKIKDKRVLNQREAEDIFILNWLLGSPPSDHAIAEKVRGLHAALEKKKWKKPLNSREFNTRFTCESLLFVQPKRDG